MPVPVLYERDPVIAGDGPVPRKRHDVSLPTPPLGLACTRHDSHYTSSRDARLHGSTNQNA